MNKSSKKNRCTSHDCLSKKLGFGQRLGEIWRDLQDEVQWKYEKLSPVQLLEKSQLHAHLMNNDELARASWFWSRRPRFLQAGSTVIWIIVALGLPLWLSIGLMAGLPLIIAAVVIVERADGAGRVVRFECAAGDIDRRDLFGERRRRRSGSGDRRLRRRGCRGQARWDRRFG